MSNFKKYMSVIQEMKEEDFFVKEFTFNFENKEISGKCIISNKCPELKTSLIDSPYDYSNEFKNGKLGDSIIQVVHKYDRNVEPKLDEFDIIINLPMPGGKKSISLYKNMYSKTSSLTTIQLMNSFTVEDSFKYNLDIAFFDEKNNINYFDIATPFYFQLNKKIFDIINEYNKKVKNNEKINNTSN